MLRPSLNLLRPPHGLGLERFCGLGPGPCAELRLRASVVAIFIIILDWRVEDALRQNIKHMAVYESWGADLRLRTRDISSPSR